MSLRRDFLPESPLADSTLYGILIGNAFTLSAAIVQHWSAGPLLWIYWAQSVVIGVLNVVRMLRLREFSTDGFTSGGVQPPPTRQTKVRTAVFFALHFGFFHFVYLVFLVSSPIGGGLPRGQALTVGVSIATFALAHGYSLWRNEGRDFRDKKPNIGTLMFYPYLRIIPMHLTIIFGSMVLQGALPLFILLKTAADAGMHAIERAIFQRSEPLAPVEAARG